MEAWGLWGCLVLVSLAFVTDIRSMRIPNWMPFTFAPAGFLLHALLEGMAGMALAGAGLAAGLLLLLPIYALGGIGAGDVKLFGAAGAWLGLAGVTELMLYSFLLGGAGGGMFLLLRGINRWRRRMAVVAVHGNDAARTGKQGATAFPFMLAVFPGLLLMWWIG